MFINNKLGKNIILKNDIEKSCAISCKISFNRRRCKHCYSELTIKSIDDDIDSLYANSNMDMYFKDTGQYFVEKYRNPIKLYKSNGKIRRDLFLKISNLPDKNFVVITVFRIEVKCKKCDYTNKNISKIVLKE
jgi:hypothetical protein